MVLAEALSRRLLTLERTVAIRTTAEYLPGRNQGVCALTLFVEPGKSASAEQAIGAWLTALLRQGFTEEEAAAARQAVLTRLTAERSTPPSLVQLWGLYEGMEASDTLAGLTEALRTVSPERLLVAAQALAPHRRVVVVSGGTP
jgi:predicted Zn-dependent peptidase